MFVSFSELSSPSSRYASTIKVVVEVETVVGLEVELPLEAFAIALPATLRSNDATHTLRHPDAIGV